MKWSIRPWPIGQSLCEADPGAAAATHEGPARDRAEQTGRSDRLVTHSRPLKNRGQSRVRTPVRTRRPVLPSRITVQQPPAIYPLAGACARDAHLSGDVGVGTCLAPLHEPPTPSTLRGAFAWGTRRPRRSRTTTGATPVVRACRIAAFQPRGATRIRFPSGSAARKVSPNPAS